MKISKLCLIGSSSFWLVYEEEPLSHSRTYRQTFNIRTTNSKNLNVSGLVLQLSLPSPFTPYVKSRMKMEFEQHRQAMLQLHLSDQQFYGLLRCDLYWYWRFGGNTKSPMHTPILHHSPSFCIIWESNMQIKFPNRIGRVCVRYAEVPLHFCRTSPRGFF